VGSAVFAAFSARRARHRLSMLPGGDASALLVGAELDDDVEPDAAAAASAAGGSSFMAREGVRRRVGEAGGPWDRIVDSPWD